jgi:hypothetical protein
LPQIASKKLAKSVEEINRDLPKHSRIKFTKIGSARNREAVEADDIRVSSPESSSHAVDPTIIAAAAAAASSTTSTLASLLQATSTLTAPPEPKKKSLNPFAATFFLNRFIKHRKLTRAAEKAAAAAAAAEEKVWASTISFLKKTKILRDSTWNLSNYHLSHNSH